MILYEAKLKFFSLTKISTYFEYELIFGLDKNIDMNIFYQIFRICHIEGHLEFRSFIFSLLWSLQPVLYIGWANTTFCCELLHYILMYKSRWALYKFFIIFKVRINGPGFKELWWKEFLLTDTMKGYYVTFGYS